MMCFFIFDYFFQFFPAEVYTASEESGAEDSDEDIITDYLSPLDDNGNLDAASASSPGPSGTTLATNISSSVSSADSTAVRISEMEPPGAAASGSSMTAKTMTTTMEERRSSNCVAADGGSIPIISVTQHSPAASKAFYILGKEKEEKMGLCHR